METAPPSLFGDGAPFSPAFSGGASSLGCVPSSFLWSAGAFPIQFFRISQEKLDIIQMSIDLNRFVFSTFGFHSKNFVRVVYRHVLRCLSFLELGLAFLLGVQKEKHTEKSKNK